MKQEMKHGKMGSEQGKKPVAKVVPENWQAKAEEYLAGWQRAKADLANFEKRQQEVARELTQYAGREILLDILPVVDNYDRAFEGMSEAERGSGWAKGFEYIRSQLLSVLEKQGVKKFESVGTVFDPALHESLAAVPGKKDVVISEVVAGYKMHERVLRHAKVKVGNGETDKQ